MRPTGRLHGRSHDASAVDCASAGDEEPDPGTLGPEVPNADAWHPNAWDRGAERLRPGVPDA